MKRFVPLLLLLLLSLAACDSADEPDDLALFEAAEDNVGAWTWLDVEGARCRDGSPTGMGVRLQEGATRLVLYLEGGGACYNPLTCAANPSRFGEADFAARMASAGTSGLFDAANPANPVGDWNVVYIPYCTGDVHAGDATDVEIPFTGTQQFVGHRNVERFLDLLGPYFADTEQVLLTGSSAGGFGAFFNYAFVADAFDAPVVLLNDSGPVPFDDDALSPGLQQRWRELWNLNATLPEGFPAPDASGDGFEDAYAFYSAQYPDATFGLLSYEHDGTIRYFFGFDPDPNVSTLPVPIAPEVFEAALYDVRDELPANWGTFFADGEAHTFIVSNARFYTARTDGVTVSEWLADLLAGTPSDVGTPGTAARGTL